MRLQPTPQPDATDPFDQVTEWAETLRNAVATELDPVKAAEIAQLAAASTVGAAASIATAAGTTAGATIGGTTMTSATASHTAAASIFSSFGSKAAAWVLAGATLTGGLAATGNLPDTVQSATADLVERIGIEIPRPALDGLINVDVGAAGSVALETVDGVLGVADLAAFAGWEATVDRVGDNELAVTFSSATEMLTMLATMDGNGEVFTEVTSRAALEGTQPAPAGEARIEGSVDGNVSVTDDAIELGSEIQIGGQLGLGK